MQELLNIELFCFFLIKYFREIGASSKDCWKVLDESDTLETIS
jgi:hypothetical protein